MSVEREYFDLYGGEVRIEFLPKSHRYFLIKDKNGILAKKKPLPGVSTIAGTLDKSSALMGYVARTNAEKALELAKGNFLPIEEIINQSKNAYLEKTSKAQDKGTILHRFMEEYSIDQNEKKAFDRTLKWIKKVYDEKPSKDIMKQVKIGAKGFIKWIKEQDVEFIETEQIVYSQKYEYVGRYDAKIKLNGDVLTADYKTSKDIYSSQIYQAAGYDIADTEQNGGDTDGTAVIAVSTEDKFDKDGRVTQPAGTINVVIRKGKELKKDKKVFLALHQVHTINKEVTKEIKAVCI